MINKKSILHLKTKVFNKIYIKPDFSKYCFTNIPNSISYLFGIHHKLRKLPDDVLSYKKKYKKVIFILIDGFGWKQLEKNKNNLYLKQILDKSNVSKITSQFPSTTANHVTTMNLNLPVGKHNLYEWYIFYPELKSIILPLLYAKFGGERDSLIDKKSKIINQKTFYEYLHENHIDSYVFQNKNYAFSKYSNLATKGSNIVDFNSLKDGLAKLTNHIKKIRKPTYCFFYYDKIDSLSHAYGMTSKEVQNEIDVFWKEIVRLIRLIKNEPDTLMIFTADHGHIEINPQKTYYLNKIFPDIYKYIKVNDKDELINPAGNIRDYFLHIKKTKVNELVKLLNKKIGKYADVFPIEKLINGNYFYTKNLPKKFINTLGNVVILPKKNNTVWWHEENPIEKKYYGHHGGLTLDEMEIPFVTFEI